jgi:hypothetical protein
LEEWTKLVTGSQAALIWPIRQEILSGIRVSRFFNQVRERITWVTYLDIIPADYDQAAAFYNRCRSRGITAGDIDMLICSVSVRYGVPVFTTDVDFQWYAEHLPVRLHTV